MKRGVDPARVFGIFKPVLILNELLKSIRYGCYKPQLYITLKIIFIEMREIIKLVSKYCKLLII